MSLPFPPRTLAVRLFLLLLAGVLAAVLVTTGLAMRERGHLLQSFREHAAAERIADMLHLLAALPPEQRSAAVRALPSGQWRIETEENASTESAYPDACATHHWDSKRFSRSSALAVAHCWT